MNKKIDLYAKMAKVQEIKNDLYAKILPSTFGKCGDHLVAAAPVYIRGGKYIFIGNNVTLDRNTRMEAWNEYENVKYTPRITIGDNVCFNPNCHIGAICDITIGDNVLIGAGVLITDHSHGKVCKEELSKAPGRRRLYSKGGVFIKNNVWIGEHVAILAGVTIGSNVIIGANAVVTKDIPDNAVIGGNPTKILKTLS